MLEPSASRFWQAALQSGLTDARALQACWDAIPPEKRTADAVDRRLGRQAVQAGVLTLWQAQQIIAGRSSGFKIDRYVLLDLIGQGGMGRVYLARDSRLNRRVALKILSPERVNNPRAIARFHREALVGAQLQHENLVRIYDEGESNGKCYLVMEYIEGKNIGQMIAENGPIPPAVAARLGRQVALGLEHAQRKGLIHRDVNPYNILVTRDGTAKLTDMGLAIDLADTDRVTRDGATVGTFDYVSPEQARHSHSVDTRSDIYSLGCSLYHMLSGRVPFPCASLPEKLFSHQASDPEPLTAAAPGVPPALAAVVARTLRKSPDERYATPLELAQALEPFVDEAGAAGGGGDVASGRSGYRQAVTVTQVATPPSNVEGPAAPAPASASPPTGVDLPAAAPVPDPAPPPVSGPGSGPVSPPSNEWLLGGIAVDLGPDPPLSQGASGRSKARATRSGPGTRADPPAGPGRRPWVVPAAAAAVAAALAVGAAVAYRSTAGGGASAGPPPAPAKTVRTPAPAPPPRRPAAVVAKKGARGGGIVVVGADGSREAVADLATAARKAIGGGGHVLLTSNRPVKVKADGAITASSKALVIRADEGVEPVLEVEVKGGKSFLSARTNAPLRIEGVTIVARFVDPGAAPAAVIEAGADVALDRCCFRAEGDAAGACAVSQEGGSLTATGCYFENFDRALDVASYGGSVVTLRQCVFARTRPDVRPGASWAVRLRNMPGGSGKTGRRLAVDHVTARGLGLLDLAGFSAESPVTVDLTESAVQADALVLWGPGPGPSARARAAGAKDAPAAPPGRDALSWSGRGDQYEVRGKSWVVLADRFGGPASAMADGPADLDAWSKRFGTELDAVPPPVRFATDPSGLTEHPDPEDFAVKSADAGPRRPGADPAHVGPGARPTPPPGRTPAKS